MIEQIAEAYGKPATLVMAPQKGYRNTSYAVRTANGELVNIIVYKREPHSVELIQRIHSLTLFLHQHTTTVRYPLDTKIMQIKTPRGVRYAAIYNYLPGNTIAWEAYTRAHIVALGTSLARLHAIMAHYAHDLPLVTDTNHAIISSMQAYFNKDGVQQALHTKLRLLPPRKEFFIRAAHIMKVCAALPQQALHLDFVRGNILFDSHARITGIIDFEKAAKGHIGFDIARTLAFLLVDCKYKEPHKIEKYFLYSGYTKRGHGILPPRRLLEQMVDFYLLHDFYKFLCHNPYQSLPANEHFCRTADILLKRNIIYRSPMIE